MKRRCGAAARCTRRAPLLKRWMGVTQGARMDVRQRLSTAAAGCDRARDGRSRRS